MKGAVAEMEMREIPREYLQQGSVLYLDKIDTNATEDIDRFDILRQLGDPGSSAVCYKAELVYAASGKRKPGTLKEFYPRQFRPDDEAESPEDTRDLRHIVHLKRTTSPDEKLDAQLTVAGDFTKENFYALRQAYVQAYERVHLAKRTNRFLTMPIGDFELYRSCTDGSDPENYTVYVWTPFDDKIETFETFLKQVCKETDRGENKTGNLKIILETIRNLALSVEDLHKANVLHLDISPRNFGLKMLHDQPEGRISLFDVNTIYAGDGSEKNSCAGTPGFRSLRLLRGQADIRCDLYSIGACLYYALVMRPEGQQLKNVCFIPAAQDNRAEHNIYKVNDALARLETDLIASPLFNDCDFNEDSDIIKELVAILKKCLSANAADAHYETAGSIAKDLEDVIARWNVRLGVEAAENDEKILTIGAAFKEDEAEKSIQLGAEGAIQWLLYKHPLFEIADSAHPNDAVKKLDILVLGGGNYASKFIDIVFQMMQIEGYETEITVASKDMVADKENFLAKRPAFRDFFEINSYGFNGAASFASEKAIKCEQAPYGKVNFVRLTEYFSEKAKKQNQRIIQSIAETTGASYSYVFIAMHNDALNLAAAEAAAAAACIPDTAPVNFVVFGDKNRKTRQPVVSAETQLPAQLVPVLINHTIDQLEDYDFLRNMAFNAHLTWNGGLEDIAGARETFLKPYNYTSSFSNALSIAYKLHSIGVDFDRADIHSVIKRFYSKSGLAEGKESDCFRKLIMFEHRRWVVESVAKGFRCLPISEFGDLRTDTKDKKGKRHPCLVPGTWEEYLGTDWSDDFHRKWKTASEDEINQLPDELDRMSVYLNRHFHNLVKTEKNRIVKEVRDTLEAMRARMPQEMRVAFDSFEQTVWSMLFETHEGIDTVSYKYYRKNLERSIRSACKTAAEDNKANAQKLSETMKSLDGLLFPVIQANAYTVWKRKDADLIRNIPFILSYNKDLHLMIPMTVRQNASETFDNVAAALMMNPAQISYVVEGKNIYDKDGVLTPAFVGSLLFAIRIMETHNLQTRIRLVVLRKKESGGLTGAEVRGIRELSERICYVKTVLFEGNTKKMQGCLNDYLRKQETSSCPVDAIATNETPIGTCLYWCTQTDGTPFPLFSFDAQTQRFSELDDRTRWVSYIPFRPSLLVDDLFASQDKTIRFNEPVLFREYGTFWNLYKSKESAGDPKKEKEDAANWKRLTGKLKSCINENLMMVSTQQTVENGKTEQVVAYLPEKCKGATDKILAALADRRVACPQAGKGSMTEMISMTMMKVFLTATASAAKALKKVFGTPEKLFDKERIFLTPMPNQLVFSYDNLSVEQFRADPDKEAAVLDLLDSISREGYLLGYHRPADREEAVSFSICSPEIKQLLTNEGKIFELYTYYCAISSGVFDDVKTNCVLKWNEDLTNEFDIVAIRGFNTYIIECKACEKLTQKMYNNLYALAGKFGINDHAILLADLNGVPSRNNTAQIDKGEAYGIRTICLPAAISPAEGCDGASVGLKKIFCQIVEN